MPVEVGPPPRDKEPRRSYLAFIEQVIAANGGWVSLPLAEITGADKKRKRRNVLSSFAARGVTCTTTIQNARMYVRLTA